MLPEPDAVIESPTGQRLASPGGTIAVPIWYCFNESVEYQRKMSISTTSSVPTLRAVPSSPVEDEEERPVFSQMAARSVSDEQYRRIMARKRFFDDLGEGVDYDPDGWID